jgi:hypothetical protein
MKRKKGLIIKLGILLSLMVVNVLAATPGSSCTIRATALGTRLTIGGRVSSNGRQCVPTSVLPILFAPLNVGVDCGANDYVIGVIRATVTCPN